MILLNCRQCDDMLKLVDLRVRTCECGKATGTLDRAGEPLLTGPARVVEIPWSEYDHASAGEWQRWRLRVSK